MPPLTATHYPVTNEDYWQFLQVAEHHNIIGRNCKYFSPGHITLGEECREQPGAGARRRCC